MGALLSNSAKTSPESSYILQPTSKQLLQQRRSSSASIDWIGKRPSKRQDGTKSSLQFRSITAKNFHYSCILGRGSAGTVRLVHNRKNKKFYALKCLRRSNIFHRKSAERTRREVDILRMATSRRCPFIVHMFHCWQDDVHVYMLLEYAAGGELYNRLLAKKRLPLNVVKFYIAEIALALQFLHSQGIAYRDLKPDNVVIDDTGHVLLCDFGLSRPVDPRTGLVVNASAGGSTSYKAPEITRGHQEPHGIAVDWWALGVVCYELFTGKTPFGNRSRDAKYEIYAKINKGKIKWGKVKGMETSGMKEMLQGLMESDQLKRWNFDNLQTCTFYEELKWEQLEKKAIEPPWVPELEKVGDHSHFQKWKEPRYPVKKLSMEALDYSNVLKRQ
jgi:protein-serine/threonine kinase